ncbi:MAG: DNA topoisomerase (ATP-hydrolyzing) subunit A [Herbinix sp.]|nr:DNA topoisomerase (ATP-hydrolyzing) subunit A [Herbinix sp.]
MSKDDLFLSGKIEQASMPEMCTESMKIFGANINLMRYLPSINDGLKPGERRIIFAMFNDLNLNYNTNHTKLEHIIGQTLLYHPHGDAPVFDTIVRLGQPWSNLCCLIDKRGNYGSPMGDPPAAARYIEGRLSHFAYKCFFEEFKPEVTDMSPNYSNSRMEPDYLPSRYPYGLVSGATGIGYGLATGVPSFNFKDVCNLTIELIKDKNYPNITLYPDSSTGAEIIDDGQFEDICKTGKGRFRMRGTIEIDRVKNTLTILSTPYLVSWNKIKTKIFEIDKASSLGIKAIEDFSGENGLNEVLHLKPEINPETIREILYRKTDMESTYPVDMKMIYNYEVKDFSMRSIILHWINIRRESKRRILNNRIIYLREREHILNILIFILNKDNAEKTIKIIKDSENRKEVISKLISNYNITSLQAESIANMKLSAFSKESRKGYKDELEKVVAEADELEIIVRSNKKIDESIIKDLEEGIKLFGEGRRSKIININGVSSIPNTEHIIVFTNGGYLKKLPAKILNIGNIPKGDFPTNIIKANNLSDILLFDERGKISKVSVSDIPSSELDSDGEIIRRFCNPKGRIVSILIKPGDDDLAKMKKIPSLVFLTKNGLIKKSSLKEYMNIRNELVGSVIKDDDELIDVRLCSGNKNVFIYTSEANAVRIPLKEISETARISMGVKAIKMDKRETVIGMDVVEKEDNYIFVMTGKGLAKRISLEVFKEMKRKEDPIKVVSLDIDDFISLIKVVKGEENVRVFMKNSDAIDMNISTVPVLPKLSKGNKVIPVRRGDLIIDVKIIL